MMSLVLGINRASKSMRAGGLLWLVLRERHIAAITLASSLTYRVPNEYYPVARAAKEPGRADEVSNKQDDRHACTA
jgi:hypothetical protein